MRRSWPFQPFQTPGPTARISAIVRIEQHFQAVERLHLFGEIDDRLAVVEIARLRDHRHGQMFLDQPGDRFGLLRRQAEARTELAGNLGAGDRMILRAALGDVVQEHGDEQRGAILDARHQLDGERMQVLVAALVDAGEHVDGAQQMLVHRIVVVHVELHQRDDLAEFRDEAAEHAGLVHPPQDQLRIAARGQHRHEEPVGFLVVAHGLGDQAERAGDLLQRGRMELQPVDIGDVEEADQVDRIALEDVRARKRDAAAVIDEFQRAGDLADAVGEAAERRGEPGKLLGLLVFEGGAEDAGEVADVLGHQEIVLHEALDGGQAGVIVIAEGFGDFALDVEGQALFGLAGQEMHVAAHRPEEIVGLLEELVFLAREHAELDQVGRILDPVEILGDPEQRVEVAQAALAFLDVRLDQIARVAGLAVALVALGELGGDEVRAGVLDDFAVETGLQLVRQILRAADIAGFEDRGADRHVAARQPDAFVDRAGGMADLEAEIPQDIEHEFDRRLGPDGLLHRQQEEKIDIRTRRQRAAAIAADGGDGDARPGLRIGGVENLVQDEIMQDGDQLVLQPGNPLGAFQPAAVLRAAVHGPFRGRRDWPA